MNDDGVVTADPDLLKMQHEAHQAVLHIFWEWRHKIMTRFAVVIGALLLALRWAYGKETASIEVNESVIRLVLLGLGSVISVAAGLLDARNQEIIRNCYSQGGEVERKLEVGAYGIFQSLNTLPRKSASYRVVLGALYFGSALVFGAAFIVEAGS